MSDAPRLVLDGGESLSPGMFRHSPLTPKG
jgi:hypothetical protein